MIVIGNNINAISGEHSMVDLPQHVHQVYCSSIAIKLTVKSFFYIINNIFIIFIYANIIDLTVSDCTIWTNCIRKWLRQTMYSDHHVRTMKTISMRVAVAPEEFHFSWWPTCGDPCWSNDATDWLALSRASGLFFCHNPRQNPFQIRQIRYLRLTIFLHLNTHTHTYIQSRL